MQQGPAEFQHPTPTAEGLSLPHTGDVIPRSESERIQFLLRRDGLEATRIWVERTLAMYRNELSRPGSYARDVTYRARFEKAADEFAGWLASVTPHRTSQAMALTA